MRESTCFNRSLAAIACALGMFNLSVSAQTFHIYSGNGHAYAVITNNLSWTAALSAAGTLPPPSGFLPGHLVTYSDADEETFVLSTWSASALNGKWIGFTDRDVEGEWKWIDTTPGIWQDGRNFTNPVQTAHTNWRTGANAEPNSDGNEDYAVYSTFSAPGPVWNDLLNSGGVFNGYVVEFEPIPRPVLDIRVSQVELCWNTTTNIWYQLQYRSTLTSNVWTQVDGTWVAGSGARYCTNDTVLVGQPQRFYQLAVTNGPPLP